VNVAETSPYVGEGVDVAAALNADRIIVHGGYHFTGDVEARTRASLDRLERTLRYAVKEDVTLLLENHNREPDNAEIHYLPVTLTECERYFDVLATENVGWAFNPPHARLFPEGIEGYLEALGVDRCAQVRLNDNDSTVEEHLAPGEGTMNFERLFELLEAAGYSGHYMLAFGTPVEMLDGREYLSERHPGVSA